MVWYLSYSKSWGPQNCVSDQRDSTTQQACYLPSTCALSSFRARRGNWRNMCVAWRTNSNVCPQRLPSARKAGLGHCGPLVVRGSMWRKCSRRSKQISRTGGSCWKVMPCSVRSGMITADMGRKQINSLVHLMPHPEADKSYSWLRLTSTPSYRTSKGTALSMI